MDRFLLQDRLELAERSVELGAEHIERQRLLIAKLEACCRDTGEARRLLRLFEELQELHVATRDHLKQQLGQYFSQED